MYEIRPESIKTFINDRNVRLPRFQRKQTWDDKKNFQLCISLFKEYPIGVCILSVDEGKGKIIRWLLDGRQRKNALQLMYEDPENIYTWSKKFIGFKNSDQPSEIEEKFWTRISEYIEDELDEELTPENDVDDTEASDGEESTELINSDTFGLDLLLEIVKIIHNQTKKSTGFTKPFDFVKYVKKLPYIENVNGIEKLSSRRVKTFIDDFQKYCDEERLDEEDCASFYKFIESRYEIINDSKLKVEIIKQWPLIRERVLIVEKIDNLLSTSKIGMIEVKNLTPSDSQKIFNIINSEGEKLTSVEILSAKPHWNIPIDNPSQTAIDAVKELYKRIGTVQDTVVRWDMPATFVKRMGKNFILKELSDSKSDFEKELTLGFKILSGLYDGGVKKENIERLGKKDLNWSVEIDQLIGDIKNMLKLIGSFSYFKYFNTWRTSLMEISSDAVSLDFLLIAYKDWERKGKPIGSDTNAKIFQKNCFILWDRLLYEYIFKLWRGSADQKTANNLSAFSNEPDRFEPISTDKWISVLKDQIFTESSIEGADISKALMEPLLYHMYCMRCIAGPDSEYDIEVDHIIPQSLFNASSIYRSDVIQHNLLNLGLLPKNENVAKSNKRLIEISDQWLIDQIEKYEFIKQAKFSEYSNINSYKEMFDEREDIFLEAYNTARTNMLNN
ncbi:MAG: DUF262 domain-containing protein [Lachnospiraceae bacterium]|nr:DUF262 domain-containing protein [Lachnospiraceae bacterium]